MRLPSGTLDIRRRDKRSDGQLGERDGGSQRFIRQHGGIIQSAEHDDRAGVEDPARVTQPAAHSDAVITRSTSARSCCESTGGRRRHRCCNAAAVVAEFTDGNVVHSGSCHACDGDEDYGFVSLWRAGSPRAARPMIIGKNGQRFRGCSEMQRWCAVTSGRSRASPSPLHCTDCPGLIGNVAGQRFLVMNADRSRSRIRDRNGGYPASDAKSAEVCNAFIMPNRRIGNWPS